ncbi:HMA2 domain-containing protein [Thioalkalivibrio sulfidiphilus]|uniref:HMA2 domain-containing protein n=1 Tax=Thioalkalivibrio sulfidiphilus TaxID=1033854 RepID=UPI0004770EC5|nr:hypothetical protein [Thioalkalivibrio sulfidiphilus]
MIEVEGVRIRWVLPGRVKLYIDDLVGEQELAERLESDVAGIDGVKDFRVDAQTGVATLRYDRKRITTPASTKALLAVLKRHFPERDFSSIEHWVAERNRPSKG